MSAFDKQEGGNHYKHLAIQPAEYCQRNKLGAMESFVVKYVSRHREKNGAADLLKAIHCLELLLEMEYPADAIKALDKGQDVPRGTVDVSSALEKHADEVAANVAANNALLRDWDQGEERMDAIGQNGNTGEHYSQRPILPWREPGEQPVAGPFDVIQVMWHDGTYSSMLPHEFGKIAEWSEVKLCRVIRDRANPEDFPLPEPHRQWGMACLLSDGPLAPHGEVEKCMACPGNHPKGAQCPNLTPHAGDHRHTFNVGHYLDVGGPAYSQTNGAVTLAGIASAVSGVNIALGGAAACVNS